MVYKLRYDRDNYSVFHLSDYEIELKLGDSFLLKRQPVSPWGSFWKTLNCEFDNESDENDVLSPPDITLWFTDNLVLSQKAYDLLSAELESYGEFLPLMCEGIPYWVLHVTKIVGVDGVDAEKSSRVIDESTFINL